VPARVFEGFAFRLREESGTFILFVVLKVICGKIFISRSWAWLHARRWLRNHRDKFLPVPAESFVIPASWRA
jgi:hypothetical protein